MTPEEVELAQKRTEARAVEENLAQKEEELANLRAEISAFERDYVQRVGPLVNELDSLLAELAARQYREAPSAMTEARLNAARAAANRDYAIGTVADAKVPSDELRGLYRQAARTLHPDLAGSEAERERRHGLMAEVNLAYGRGDIDQIRRILGEHAHHPDEIVGDSVGAELIRIIRKISRGRARIEAVDVELRSLKASAICELFERASSERLEGVDLLDASCLETTASIEQVKRRLSR
jgi:hypothetical protein